MKKVWKRMAAVFLAAVLMISLTPMMDSQKAHAVGDIASGTTGTCKWSLYKVGTGPTTLCVQADKNTSKPGIMEDYKYDSGIDDINMPWREYRDQIEAVEFYNVREIGNYSFYGCNKITGALEIKGVERIGDHAFAWCKNLGRIYIEGKNCIIEDDAFLCCEDRIMSSVTLNGVKSIGEDSFEEIDCYDLELGEGIESIGRGAFNCNEVLTVARIPKSCKSIGYSAFGGCSKMVSAYIKNPDCEIGDYAFEKTVTIGVKKNSKALEWAKKNNYEYKFFGDMGSGTFTITEAGVKLTGAREEDYSVAASLEALLADGKVSYQTEGEKTFYMDLNKDSKWDVTIERQEDDSLIIKALKERSVGGPVVFKMSEMIVETAENNGMPYYSTFTIKLPKIAGTMTVSPRTATVKYKKLKKKNQTLAVSKVLTIKKAKGTLSFKKTKGNKKITINKSTGKVTVKKKLKKGKYKITVNVTDAGDAGHKALTKTVTFTVKVK